MTSPTAYRTEHVRTLPNGFEVHRVVSINDPKLREWHALREENEGSIDPKFVAKDAAKLHAGTDNLFVAHAPDGSMVAYSHGEWETSQTSTGRKPYYVGATKTKRDLRRRGIAKALLRAHVEWAMAHPGAHSVEFEAISDQGEGFLKRVGLEVRSWVKPGWTLHEPNQPMPRFVFRRQP